MATAELGEYLFGGPRPAVGDVVLALAEGLVHIGACRDVEESLTLFRTSVGVAGFLFFFKSILNALP